MQPEGVYTVSTTKTALIKSAARVNNSKGQKGEVNDHSGLDDYWRDWRDNGKRRHSTEVKEWRAAQIRQLAPFLTRLGGFEGVERRKCLKINARIC